MSRSSCERLTVTAGPFGPDHAPFCVARCSSDGRRVLVDAPLHPGGSLALYRWRLAGQPRAEAPLPSLVTTEWVAFADMLGAAFRAAR